jgi:starch synthase
MSFRAKWEPDMKFLGEANVRLAWRDLYCGVFELKRDNITYYFVDNRHYFDREGIYGYFDDGERFAFFSKSIFAVMELTKFIPDVIHAHDWQTALVPIYLKTQFMGPYHDIRSVFTIHNIEYQGRFARDILTDVFGLWEGDAGIVEYDYSINLMKGAIVACDKLTTVSDSYCKEIMHGGGFGLDAIIRENEYKLSGIVNGIDIDLFNPATDKVLKVNYSSETLDLKPKNKVYLQEYFHLPKAPGKMLICMISRLVSHKGLDLVTYVMEELLNLDVQFLLLGTGEHDYELFFEEMALLKALKVVG